MAHTPDFSFDGEFWNDENQPDSDQFHGTSEEWLAVLAAQGIRPPQHADMGGHGGQYAPEVVIVSIDAGSIYRIGGDTLALRDRRTGAWVRTGQ